MIVLLIGYGSIGQKHCKILSNHKKIKQIHILTKQKIEKKYYKCNNLSEVKKINPDYIIISNNTKKHYSTLFYINKIMSNKVILVEKPLFEKFYKFQNLKNKIFVGYNLRFHPVILKIKKIIQNKKVYSINSFCLSDLKKWRKNIHYSKSSSAKKSDGGGVILDLSHEFDYISWIFGKLSLISFVSKKISNLKINTEDYLSLISKVKNIIIQINLNYFSLSNERKIYIDGKNFSMIGDLNSNSLKYIYNNKTKTYNFKKFKIIQTYKNMHEDILNKNYNNICSFKEANKILQFINLLK